jgi:2-dehydro-3-deoxyphosphogluconate aldolase / (4S)-4-hydroxy-2-oxoglutarate aldolase
MKIEDVMSLSPVIAVVTVRNADDDAPLTRALVAGGVPAVEITLRTPSALDAVRAAASVPGAVAGAGTVLSAAELHAGAGAGAVFAVSPGATPALLDAGRDGPIPLLPGVATASEVMAGLERGYRRFKFFPAEAAGGRALLEALSGPFPQALFCPTGGVNLDNAREYLTLGCDHPRPPALVGPEPHKQAEAPREPVEG